MKTIIKKLLEDKSKNVISFFSQLNEEERKIIDSTKNETIDISDIVFDNKMNILKETFGISRNLPLNSIIKKENLFINITETTNTSIINDQKENIDNAEKINSNTIDDVVMKNEKENEDCDDGLSTKNINYCMSNNSNLSNEDDEDKLLCANNNNYSANEGN